MGIIKENATTKSACGRKSEDTDLNEGRERGQERVASTSPVGRPRKDSCCTDATARDSAVRF